jgi:erythronate-4-phosphate dehydrogenase
MKRKTMIFIDENIPYLKQALNNCGQIIEFNGRKLKRDDLIVNNCEILFTRSTTTINKNLLDNTKVEFVGSATSGIDHVDTDYLKRRKIFFADAKGSNANSVAELVVYGTIKWSYKKKFKPKGKTIGIIGYGSIGKIVTRFAEYLGMKVLVNDPPLKDEGFEFPENINYMRIDELCRKSDIISNHVPLTKEGKYPTDKLLNEERINLIRNGSLVIHTSRGGVIDERSLINRLQCNELDAVIDVWENEPLINKELINSSLLVTPHVGGYSLEGKLRGALAMANAFQNYSQLKPDLSEINNILSEYNPVSKEYYKDIDQVYDLLSKRRNFGEDDKALRKTMLLSDEKRSNAFDLLRKNYPQRRESL